MGFSFKVKGANCLLSYNQNGTRHSASVRVKDLKYEYSAPGTESQSRESRAFYPHRRTHGKIHLVVECITYREYLQFMKWCRGYTDLLLNSSQQPVAAPISISIPSRKFERSAILCGGLGNRDNVGSMVFKVNLEFLTLNDPSDPKFHQAVRATNTSEFEKNLHTPDLADFFYPVTVSNAADSTIYDVPKLPNEPSGPTLDELFPIGGVPF